MDKPLLGATPDFIIIPRRNVELSEAILRYSKKSEETKATESEVILIKRWATEIIGNCNTQLKIMEIENKATTEQ